jgi:uncharacterized repeat protein (TIGR01451 family)/prepilin-type processing-associated H-X9-DG protein
MNNPYPRVTSEDLDLIPGPSPRPTLVVEKAASIVQDRNGNGAADPAEVIAYTIAISNTGAATATNVQLRDTPDANTTLMTGTVTLSPAGGTVLRGNRLGDRSVEVAVGTIAAGASVRVQFMVRVNDHLPAGVATILNQAIVRGTDVPDTPSDDPRTPIPGDPTTVPSGGPPGGSPGGGPPTAIDLRSFDAISVEGGVQVRWATGVEAGTFGYTLLRSNSDSQDAAVAVSGLLPARAHGGGGANYTYADSSAAPGVAYHYWLVETERGGANHVYGPAITRMSAPAADIVPIYLPLVIR